MKRKQVGLVLTLLAASGLLLAGIAQDQELTQQSTMKNPGVSFASGVFRSRSEAGSELVSLGQATEWLNSPPLTPEDLHGKVVLVQFWTYTCINWLRQAPYVQAWASKYKDHGLVVVGVHSPEFAFERDLGNIAWAVDMLDVDHPVAIDSDHTIWRAFNNSYWPALYFIDAEGQLRHHHFGEGSYDESEEFIQKLLTEAGASGVSVSPVQLEPDGLGAPADWTNLKSPEIYVGYGRGEGPVSSGRNTLDKPNQYQRPSQLHTNEWGLSGEWTVGRESAVLNSQNGGLAIRFHARDLHLVMGPSEPGAEIGFRILIDGLPPDLSHGLDTDEQGFGVIKEQRLYQLLRQAGPIVARQMEIEFYGVGAEAFAFTFG